MKIAIDPNKHRIHMSRPEYTRQLSNLEAYLAITALWEHSAALSGDPPLGYSYQTDEITLDPQWRLELFN